MMKYFLILSIITLISTQVFLESEEEKFQIDTNGLVNGVKELISKIENKFPFNFSEECKTELQSLKSIIEIIKDSHGTDEIIFNATKDLVNHFPGINQKCGVPLPTINTDNWSLENFKKFSCGVKAVTFATTIYACINGVYTKCAKIIVEVKPLIDCVKILF
jgi:hypothetical protein